MTTQVPLTRANVLFYTGASGKEAERCLDSMVADGVLDIDTDDNGDLLYVLRGARRPEGAPTELVRCSACNRATGKSSRCARCGQITDARLRGLRNDIDRAGSALALFGGGRGRSDLLTPHAEGEKSVLAAGILGLFTGPLGWLYAAPLREAVPAVVVFLVLWKLIGFLLFALLPIMPASAIIGALYAWKYNRTGRRTGLITNDDPHAPGGS